MRLAINQRIQPGCRTLFGAQLGQTITPLTTATCKSHREFVHGTMGDFRDAIAQKRQPVHLPAPGGAANRARRVPVGRDRPGRLPDAG
jgi:hypothetical protein